MFGMPNYTSYRGLGRRYPFPLPFAFRVHRCTTLNLLMYGCRPMDVLLARCTL